MTTLDTGRVIVIGAGLAGLYAALKLAPLPVLLISPEPLGSGASSAWAQGGVAAAMGTEDTPMRHAADTIRAGAGIVDAAVARYVTGAAPSHVLDLTGLGTPFDRDALGNYLLSREAAHSIARVVRVRGDQAGREIMATLVALVEQTPRIARLEGAVATDLVMEGSYVTGVQVAFRRSGVLTQRRLTGRAVLLAGGGSAGLYALTTNPPRVRGQVIGMAARAGAWIADAEFVQFHPTAIDIGLDPAPLATEALRGEGAILVNRRRERFMLGLHPDAELAPRDVVARAVYAQTQAGLRPALDTRAALGDRLLQDFPAVAAACAAGGVDPLRDPIPVAAAAHYHMGGVEVDLKGRSNLGGLWACGETSSTGLHGANRLASNGLLEALVFAETCARDIRDRIGEGAGALPPLPFRPDPQAPDPDADAVAGLRQLMTDNVGVVREAVGLGAALAETIRLEAESEDPQLRNMAATAALIAAAALVRKESRGAHFRSDVPEPRPDYAQRSTLTLEAAREIRVRGRKEPA
ncbi:L-aspartate oxidase [Solirhodobacter olei]|uniref:L-aspartate oxidase n=1 Tax=Solirhodobacter olei TaxID=2493082 RepID=UPI000FD78509|nr:L-aspartate oxidase [Solirhodobacter olei]